MILWLKQWQQTSGFLSLTAGMIRSGLGVTLPSENFESSYEGLGDKSNLYRWI